MSSPWRLKEILRSRTSIRFRSGTFTICVRLTTAGTSTGCTGKRLREGSCPPGLIKRSEICCTKGPPGLKDLTSNSSRWQLIHHCALSTLQDGLGNLEVGCKADIAVLQLVDD